jgi:hypothetical protein
MRARMEKVTSWCVLGFSFAFAMSATAMEYRPALGAATENAGRTGSIDSPHSPAPIIVPRMAGPEHYVGGTVNSFRYSPADRAAASAATIQPPRQAPMLTSSFVGIQFDSFFPPDPGLAAGPTNLVAVVNGRIALFEKTGTALGERTLNNFFNGSRSATFLFDPRVVYDPHSSRFIVAALDGQSSPSSWLRVAVSKTSNPTNLSVGASATQDWRGYDVDADQDGGQQINQNWADFTGLGVDSYNVYVTANMFSNSGVFQYAKVWIIRKDDILAGGSPTVLEFGAPPGTLGNPVTGFEDFTITPVLDFDAGNEHMLSTNAISADGSSGGITLWTVEDPSGAPTLSNANLDVPGWNGLRVPNCAQMGGGSSLDTGDTRILNAIERNGSAWATHAQPSQAGDRAEVRWYEIDPAGNSLIQSGDISDPQRCYFFPVIQADAQGNVCVVMSGVDATIFGSAFYTSRLASDPAGTMQAVAPLQLGMSNYVLLDDTKVNRWGDFGGITEDPSSGDIWMVHEYASASANKWSTWIGRKLAPEGTPSLTPTPTMSVLPITATMTLIPTSPAPTPTATRSAPAPPTDTTLPTVTPTPSATASVADTATATPSSTPTPPPVRGDVSCDGRVSAADLTALVELLPSAQLGACGLADVNDDTRVTSADIGAVIEVIFSAPI